MHHPILWSLLSPISEWRLRTCSGSSVQCCWSLKYSKCPFDTNFCLCRDVGSTETVTYINFVCSILGIRNTELILPRWWSMQTSKLSLTLPSCHTNTGTRRYERVKSSALCWCFVCFLHRFWFVVDDRILFSPCRSRAAARPAPQLTYAYGRYFLGFLYMQILHYNNDFEIDKMCLRNWCARETTVTPMHSFPKLIWKLKHIHKPFFFHSNSFPSLIS